MRITVKVEQRHIDEALRGEDPTDTRRCPIARASAEALGLPFRSVGITESPCPLFLVKGWAGHDRFVVPLPEEANAQAMRFTKSRKMDPFEFTVELSERAVTAAS